MDLVGILHMVDTPSSGKHDFNYIYAVSLIVSILIHFDSVSFESVHIDSALIFPLRCSYNVHVLVWLLDGCTNNMGLCVPFLTVGFLSIFTVLLLVLGVVLFSMELCGFPSFFWHMWTIMMEIDHPAIRFLLCFFSQVQYFVLVSGDSYGFAILVLLFMDDHGVTWSSYGNTHRECYTEVHIHQHLMHIYTCVFQPLYPFIILL